jgi:hypothetical protein
VGTKLTFKYDRIGDILYINKRRNYPEQESEELSDDVLARLNPETGEVDGTYGKSPAAGPATVTEVIAFGIVGDRVGRVRRPLGNIWWIQTHLEDVSRGSLPSLQGPRHAEMPFTFNEEMDRQLKPHPACRPKPWQLAAMIPTPAAHHDSCQSPALNAVRVDSAEPLV